MLGSIHCTEAAASTAGWRSLAQWRCREEQVSIHSDPPWAFLAAEMPAVEFVENWQLPAAFPSLLECIATPRVGLPVSQVSLTLRPNLEKEFAAHYLNRRPIRQKDGTLTHLGGCLNANGGLIGATCESGNIHCRCSPLTGAW